jgi:hypothetical protein
MSSLPDFHGRIGHGGKQFAVMTEGQPLHCQVVPAQEAALRPGAGVPNSGHGFLFVG